MKELPILFSTPMVQALLEGRKTKTRRTNGLEKINENPDDWKFEWADFSLKEPFCFTQLSTVNEKTLLEKSFNQERIKPKYQKGDILWVKETYSSTSSDEYIHKITRMPFIYRADFITTDQIKHMKAAMIEFELKWKSSRFMPKSAARIWLKVTDVKVERLQSISAEDAIKEGIKPIEGLGYTHYTAKKRFTKEELKEGVPYISSPILSFLTLWESINGEESLNANPWVFVYSFEVISTNGKPLKTN